QTLTNNGNFSFVLDPNTEYNLSASATAPEGYEQTCTVTNGSGIANGANATLPVTATVSCSTQPLPITEYSLSVAVTGLETGTAITLTNLEDDIEIGAITTNGTVLVTDLQPYDLYDLSVSVTQPDFSALGKDAIAGTSVWMQSCAFADDSAQGAAEGNAANIVLTLNCGSHLYFAADGNNGAYNQLWRTDGSAAGTSMVVINPYGDANPDNLTMMNGKLYFVANDGVNGKGKQLWVSDGTAEGTKRVQADSTATHADDPQHLIVMNNKLYFAASDTTHGSELWVSDGTAEGTKMVKNINSAANNSNPHSFVILNDKLYFSAQDFYGPQLWESDGTEAGTKNTLHGPNNLANLTVLNDKLYFSGTTSANGAEPWVSDGTSAGSK